MTAAELRLSQARARVRRAEEYLAEVRLLDEGRADLKARYEEVFRRQLDVDLASSRREIAVAQARLDTMQRIAARTEQLMRRGAGSSATLDEAALRVDELELTITQAQAALNSAQVRRDAADHGIFIGADGDDPDWAPGGRLELKIEEHAHQVLHEATSELELAEADLHAAQADLQRRSEAAVPAPAEASSGASPPHPARASRPGRPSRSGWTAVGSWSTCRCRMRR